MTRDWLDEVTVVPVLRHRSAQECLAAATRVLDLGYRVIEVALTTPGALEVIADLATRGTTVGAGTVLGSRDVRDAQAAGAAFCVAPVCDPDLVRVASVDVVLAGATPTEILTAHRSGARLVKVFPVAHLGGPAYIRSLLAPLPFLRLFPSGGVRLCDVDDYLAAGAVVAGLGDLALS